jgi:hypothetical protein
MCYYGCPTITIAIPFVLSLYITTTVFSPTSAWATDAFSMATHVQYLQGCSFIPKGLMIGTIMFHFGCTEKTLVAFVNLLPSVFSSTAQMKKLGSYSC